MNKIQKVSSFLLIGFNILLISIPLMVIIQWLFIDTKISSSGDFIQIFHLLEKTIETPEGYINLSTVHWTLFTKLLAFCSAMLQITPFILSLFVLKSIVKNYHKNEIFSITNALLYRKLGWIFFLNALLIKSLSHTLMVLAVTLANPPGHRYLTLSFGTPNMEALFYGALVIVVSWVMLEANKLHDEQKFII
jgi:hypothetical protein